MQSQLKNEINPRMKCLRLVEQLQSNLSQEPQCKLWSSRHGIYHLGREAALEHMVGDGVGRGGGVGARDGDGNGGTGGGSIRGAPRIQGRRTQPSRME